LKKGILLAFIAMAVAAVAACADVGGNREEAAKLPHLSRDRIARVSAGKIGFERGGDPVIRMTAGGAGPGPA